MKSVRVWAGAAISLIALVLAFHGVDFAAVGSALLRANYLWLAVSLLLVTGSILLRARRWQALFAHPDRLHLGRLFGVLNIGYFFNTILPLRAGELARVVLLAQVEDVSRLETLSTIVVERIVDTLAVILLLAAVTPLVHVPSIATRPVIALSALLLLLVIALILAAIFRAASLRLIEHGARLLPERFRAGVVRQAGAALDGLSALRRPRSAAEVIGLTVLVYVMLGAAMVAQLAAFHIHLGVMAAFFLLAAATLGLVVPASPGSVGVWEGIMIAVLTGIFSIDRGVATGLALVSHVVFFAPPVFLAAISFWRLQASWNSAILPGRRVEATAAGLPSLEESPRRTE